MKPIKNYILIVDGHRDFRHDYMKPRSTADRYRVGAKTQKEAVELLREKIGFGSICVGSERICENDKFFVPYKTVVKEISTVKNGEICFEQIEPHHATDNQKNNFQN